jgi:hypothetical protein
VNELALMLGTAALLDAAAAGADEVAVDGGVLAAVLPPDELLPQAVAAIATPASAATYARFLVTSKMSSRGGADQVAQDHSHRPGTAFVRSCGP